MKILGKGFFLMMHLIAIGFLFISALLAMLGVIPVILIILSSIAIYFLYWQKEDLRLQQILSSLSFVGICFLLFVATCSNIEKTCGNILK